MSAHGTLRGHKTYKDRSGTWRYVDTGDPTFRRDCGHCGTPDRDDGHDACIGELKGGVMNACCGHGQTAEAYIQYWTGERVAGEVALTRIRGQV